MRRSYRAFVASAGVALGVGVVPSAVGAAEPAEVINEVSHEDEVFPIEANPACGDLVDMVETQHGVERFHRVEHGDSVHVAAGESVWTTVSSEDPDFEPLPDRKISEAIAFHDINGGQVVVFHSSFQDRNTVWGDIQVRETFVQVSGDTKVERFTGKNLPPDGC